MPSATLHHPPVSIAPGAALSGMYVVEGTQQIGQAPAAADTNGYFTSAGWIKLAGIQAGATANETDDFLLSRANHTGTQAQSTINGLVAFVSDTTAILNGLTSIIGLPGGSGTFTNNVTITDSVNAAGSEFSVRNTNAGSAASARISMGNNASATLLIFDAMSSTFVSGISAAQANTSRIQANGVGGLALVGNAGTVRLYGSGNTTDAMRINNVGAGFGAIDATRVVDINSDAMRLRTAKTPASAGAAGNQGDICWDANYVYICTATNTWRRAAISSW